MLLKEINKILLLSLILFSSCENLLIDANKTLDQKTKCINENGYRYRGDNVKSCSWIRRKEGRRKRLCSRRFEVRTNCPQTCGVCCENDDSFIFPTEKNGKKKVITCQWIQKWQVRQAVWCKRRYDGMSIREICPKSCKKCKRFVPVQLVPGFFVKSVELNQRDNARE